VQGTAAVTAIDKTDHMALVKKKIWRSLLENPMQEKS